MLFCFVIITLVSSLQIVGCTGGREMVAHPQEHSSCNKALCASIVSYCMIQEKCGCDPGRNCSCCSDCALCLGDYYRHCCDCVGMRKGSNYTVPPLVLSTVGELDEPEPKLFWSLTTKPMPPLRYTIFRFSVMDELVTHRRHHSHHREHGSVPRPADGSNQFWNDVQVVLRRDYDLNDDGFSHSVCTAAYFDRCMPLNECRWSCERMGASSFRWFHNGCCECAGPTCLNYGNRFLKCSECMQ